MWQSALSSQSDGLTTFHCYLQSLPPCLFYIEHILPQRHTPTTPVHTLTTRGRFCAAEEPLLWFCPLTVSISCTDKDFVQGCCCCCCPDHPLSPQPIRGASQVHVIKEFNLKDSLVSWYTVLYSSTVQSRWINLENNSDENRFLFFAVVAGLSEMRCAEMDECLVHRCACYLPGWVCVVSVPRSVICLA